MSEKVFIVTGAAGGIGNEIVRNLVETQAANVVATDIVEGSLQSQKAHYGEKLVVIIGDIVDPAVSQKCVQAAIDNFGRLDGVSLTAGIFGACYRLADASFDKWKRGFEINVFSYLNTLHFALPELRKTKGCVVAATSGAGDAALFSGWGFYGASKAAVAFLIKQVHLEEHDVTAVGISPGLCDTKMIENLRGGKTEGWTAEDVTSYEEFVSKIEMVTPVVAASSYAQVLTKGSREISGLIMDYDDARLPIDDSLKRKNETERRSYAQYSAQASTDLQV